MLASSLTQLPFTRNLQALGPRNADLAERLGGEAPRPGVEFLDTPQGVPAVVVDGVALCSRHRPLDEADRLAAGCDIVEHAVFAVMGFGAGYHVRRLAERLGKHGVILVFEPDVALLRSVLEHVDHASWLTESIVVFLTDPDDRGALAGKLHQAEAIIAQGLEILVHPASRSRLGDSAQRFGKVLADHVDSAKVTLLTTLMRSVDTIRNYVFNIDHYAAGAGVLELRGAAAGRPAVVVSAGPSLKRNLHLLTAPGVRERCLIIAAQTTLRPLLDAGVRPHFVTALDYHEISRRFYAGLTPDEVAGTTLVVDPKAHPVILDSFPGALRCCTAPFLDELLGSLRRPMGDLPPGATVAHLALYLARYMGCDPVALIGQDLAFSDGLYYAPGTAIAEVWAPELNPFNTMEMMEWQRIVRHRLHLRKLQDVHGRPVYSDMQMLTYLQQFERDFAAAERQGLTTIDATEGGLEKQHTRSMPLAEFLERYATEPLPELPAAPLGLDPGRLGAAGRRLAEVSAEIDALRAAARSAADLLRRMLEDQDDPAAMSAHFRRIEALKLEVERRSSTFAVLRHLNQLGEFRRFKADRRLSLCGGLSPREHQRAQIQRDLDNVSFIADASEEILEQLGCARRIVAGEAVAPPSAGRARLLAPGSAESVSVSMSGACDVRIAALLPVDPLRNGLGIPRSLAEPFGGRPVIQATLERLGRCEQIESIVLIAPEGFDVEALLDRSRIGLPVHVERCDGSPFGPEQAAIAAARLWADTCWRGGIAGMSAWDEVLCPGPMLVAMRRHELTAALLVAPDWPLVDVSGATGCDAIATRHRDLPAQHKLVFTQAPPGLAGCLVSATLMESLQKRHRLSTIGALLAYQPHLPQHDPIARSVHVQTDELVSRSRVRATFDAERHRRRLAPLAGLAASGATPLDIVRRLEAGDAAPGAPVAPRPRHLVMEITGPAGAIGLDRAKNILGSAAAGLDDAVLTLQGRLPGSDPLDHPELGRIIAAARAAGFRGVHVRSALRASRDRLERLLDAAPDVVSVDLHADRPETYLRTMGADRFSDVIEHIEFLVANRRLPGGRPGPAPHAALALPWIVPRLRRCQATCEDQELFFDRWTRYLGAAVIEGGDADGLLPTETPRRVLAEFDRDTLVVRE